MRILEQCVSAWPMPETEAQINGLRSAFSADTSRPFELKPSFPLGSPPGDNFPTPPALHSISQAENYQTQQPTQQPPQVIIPPSHGYMNQQISGHHQGSYLATPPVSAVSESKSSPLNQHAYDINTHVPGMPSGNFYGHNLSPHEAPQWNPTPIIDQFNQAFAIPASALAPPAFTSSPPVQMTSGHPNYNIQNTPSPPYPAATTFPPSQQHQAYYADMQRQQQHHQQQHQQPQQQHMQQYIDSGHSGGAMSHSMQQAALAAAGYGQAPPDSVYVTPKQWQQSVASVYEGGLKRRWDSMQQGGGDPQQQAMKRR
jgi:hypothetical protein